jgi:hypothetical protein
LAAVLDALELVPLVEPNTITAATTEIAISDPPARNRARLARS